MNLRIWIQMILIGLILIDEHNGQRLQPDDVQILIGNVDHFPTNLSNLEIDHQLLLKLRKTNEKLIVD